MRKSTTAALAAFATITILTACGDGGGGAVDGGDAVTPEAGGATSPAAGGEVLIDQSFLEGPGVFSEGELEQGRVAAERGFLLFSFTGPTAFSAAENFEAPHEAIHIETDVSVASGGTSQDVLYGVYCSTGAEQQYQVFLRALGEVVVFRNGPAEDDFDQVATGSATLPAQGTPHRLDVDCVSGGVGQPTQITVAVDGAEVLATEDPAGLGSFTGVALAIDSSASEDPSVEGEIGFQHILVTSA